VKKWKIFGIYLGALLIFIGVLFLSIHVFTLRRVTGIIFFIVLIVEATIIVRAVYLAKKNPTKKKLKRFILFTLLGISTVIITVANVAIYKFTVPINQLLSSPTLNSRQLKSTKKASKKMVEKVSDEGFVLLKNQQQALPLIKQSHVSIFGSASVAPVYGGSGSGAGNEKENVTLQQGLKNAGFQVNPHLTKYYKSHKIETKKQNNFNLVGADYRLKEPNLSQQQLTNARDYANTALIVLSRRGGEGGDLPTSMAKYDGNKRQNYLELTSQEKNLIQKVKAKKFKRVIAVINSSNPMELGFLNDQGIDGAILIGGPGATGMNSLGNILAGKVDPSGRLTDTYAYDATSSPAYVNSGNFTYANHAKGQENAKYVDYAEGIYVGYRYYETRYVDNKTNKTDEKSYHQAVQYPFGYGLSYTKFDQKVIKYSSDANNISMTVKVKNTGGYVGKDVVQMYYSAPYYEGGIEKAHVNLAAFDKTKRLKPGQSQQIKLKLKVSDMASYDYKQSKAYVLDAGHYKINLMNNSHDVIASRNYTVPKKVIYNKNGQRSGDQNAAKNQFDQANGNLTYLSRANWQETFPKAVNHKTASKQLLAQINRKNVTNKSTDKPINFAHNGLKLADLKNVDYSSNRWDKYLAQFSVSQMKYLIGNSLFSTQSIPSQGVPGTVDTDGPAGLNNILRGVNGVQYCSAVVTGSTWNSKLIKQAGKALGNELKANGNAGVYAPAVNIHRTPFSGRNFEYYSEDGLLSGKSAAAFVSGIKSKGVFTYVKHFALNDQETNRDKGVSVWANEQAIREVYLKAFEIPVKEGKTTAIMSSYNRIGGTWSGADKGLMTNVLRKEWGFKGMVVTDMNLYDYQDVDQGIRAGNDMMLSSFGKEPTKLSNTNTGKQAMRRATHHILYTLANSSAMTITTAFPKWIIYTGIVEGVLLGLLSWGYAKVAKPKNKDIVD